MADDFVLLLMAVKVRLLSLKIGKLKVQSYVVQAWNRTWDPCVLRLLSGDLPPSHTNVILRGVHTSDNTIYIVRVDNSVGYEIVRKLVMNSSLPSKSIFSSKVRSCPQSGVL